MLVPKKFYGLRRFSHLVARDLFKLILLLPAGWGVEKPEPAAVSHDYKHLVVLRPDLVGDFVVFARDFHRYRALYSADEWTVTLIGNKAWRTLAEEWNCHFDNGWFDRFIEIDRKALEKKFRYRRGLAKYLKGLECDELIYPVHSRDVWGGILARWISAETRVTPVGDTACMIGSIKRWLDTYFSRLISLPKELIQEVERNDHFLRALGDESVESETFKLLPVTPRMKSEAIAALEDSGIRGDEPFFVIFPGASWIGKCWPAESFVQWARNQIARHDVRIVVCGGSNETALAEEIKKRIGSRAINLAGRTSLIGLTGVFALAKLLISNDTSAVHIASAVGCPVICILGGGHGKRFWPYGNYRMNRTMSHYMPCFGCGWECRYPVKRGRPMPCIESITCE